jgi:hypothetical protein
MIISTTAVTPTGYRVTQMDVIVPLAVTYGSHLIWPFALDTDITTFTARLPQPCAELKADRSLVLDVDRQLSVTQDDDIVDGCLRSARYDVVEGFRSTFLLSLLFPLNSFRIRVLFFLRRYTRPYSIHPTLPQPTISDTDNAA